MDHAMQGEAEPAKSGAPSRHSSSASLQSSQPPSRGPSFRAAPAAEDARKKGPAIAKKEPAPPEPVSHTTEMFAHLPPFKVEPLFPCPPGGRLQPVRIAFLLT